MCRLARQVQRSLLHRGKITRDQYDAYRKRGRDLIEDAACARDSRFNAPTRRWAKLTWQTLGLQRDGSPQEAIILNLLNQASIRDFTYHPTKGFRSSRSAERV